MDTQPANTQEKQQTLIHSPRSNEPRPTGNAEGLSAAIDAAETILPALRRLCSSKTRMQLTGHQSETWLAALSVYRPAVVNEAIVRLACNDDPFPDLGKLLLRCDRINRERNGTQPMNGESRLGTGSIKRIAAAWGLDLGHESGEV